jgi:phosphoadenosine phosphosulfate reductase
LHETADGEQETMTEIICASALDSDLLGRNKELMAIERIREFEPAEGYYLAFSGGKDSVVLYDLAKRAGVKFDAHMSLTTVDPPEVIRFVRTQYPEVKTHRPKKSMFQLIPERGLPMRNRRWCCEVFKEIAGDGRIVLTGIRWEESLGRGKRRMVEICQKNKSKVYVHPVIDWSGQEIWHYIRTRALKVCELYSRGFRRIGCIGCPFCGWERRRAEFSRYPRIANAYKRAATRLWLEHKTEQNIMGKFRSAEEFFEWWVMGTKHEEEPACPLFV